MSPRTPRAALLWTCLCLYWLAGMLPVQGLVLCLDADGGAHMAFASLTTSCHAHDHDGGDEPEPCVRSHDCHDLPLWLARDDQQQQQPGAKVTLALPNAVGAPLALSPAPAPVTLPSSRQPLARPPPDPAPPVALRRRCLVLLV